MGLDEFADGIKAIAVHDRGQTLTLAGFLLARIAEDEAEANRWIADREPWDGGAFMVFHAGEPERVLAECEAKRRIVNWYQNTWDRAQHTKQRDDDLPAWYLRDCVAMLAEPYADHPDFRPEWRL